MVGFLQRFSGMSAGQVLDMVQRKVQIRRWRQREEISVRCADQRVHVRTRRGTTDAEVIWQCFVGNQYEVPKVPNVPPFHYEAVQAFYSDIIQSGKKPLIIDCGANMGASALWFNTRYPGSTIVAVEPAASNVTLLRDNCDGKTNISVVDAGVGSENGQAFLQDSGGGHWGYQTSEKQTSKPVDIIALSTLIENNLNGETTPFILKIDVEGAEKSLFDHSLDLIAAFPVIIFEPHDFYMPGARTASPFFRFHADAGRDFAFGYENVFSLDMASLNKSRAVN